MREIFVNPKKINLDSGVFFSQGVFETILVKDRPIFLNFHLERLKFGVNTLNIIELKNNEIDSLIIKINNLNLRNIILKISVTNENIIITTRDIPYNYNDYKKGFKLIKSNVIRNSTSILNKVKSTAYIENILEKNKAIKLCFNEVLFINEKGNICETSTGNLFFVENDRIYTPNIREGLLNGAVRNFIIENFDVEFKNYKIEDLHKVDEIFMTNSIIGIIKIIKIDKLDFKKHDLTEKIGEFYNNAIKSL